MFYRERREEWKHREEERFSNADTEEVHNRAWNLSHISWLQSKCLNHKIILQAWDTSRNFNSHTARSSGVFEDCFGEVASNCMA